MAVQVSELLENSDVKGAEQLAAWEEETITMAPNNQCTVDALISKHPHAIHQPQYTENEVDITTAIRSFLAGLVAGLHGLRP